MEPKKKLEKYLKPAKCQASLSPNYQFCNLQDVIKMGYLSLKLENNASFEINVCLEI